MFFIENAKEKTDEIRGSAGPRFRVIVVVIVGNTKIDDIHRYFKIPLVGEENRDCLACYKSNSNRDFPDQSIVEVNDEQNHPN